MRAEHILKPWSCALRFPNIFRRVYDVLFKICANNEETISYSRTALASLNYPMVLRIVFFIIKSVVSEVSSENIPWHVSCTHIRNDVRISTYPILCLGDDTIKM